MSMSMGPMDMVRRMIMAVLASAGARLASRFVLLSVLMVMLAVMVMVVLAVMVMTMVSSKLVAMFMAG